MTDVVKIPIKVEGADKAKKELKEVKGSMDDISGIGDALGLPISKLTGALEIAKKGVKGLTLGFQGMKGALIATGIGALIVLLGSLVSWLSTTQSGTDALSKSSNSLKAYWISLKESGFGLFKSFVQVGVQTAILKAQMDALVDANKKVNEEEIENITIKAELSKINKELNLIVEDTNKTTEERLIALNEQSTIEKGLIKLEVEEGEARVKLIEQELAITKSKKDVKDSEVIEIKRRLETEKANIIKHQSDLASFETTQLKKTNQIKDTDAADQEQRRVEQEQKDLDAANKKTERQQKELQTTQQLEDSKNNIIKDAQTREIAQLNTQFQRKIDLAGKDSVLGLQLEEERKIKEKEITDKYDKIKIDGEKVLNQTIEDLKNVLIIDEEARAIAQTETKFARLIEEAGTETELVKLLEIQKQQALDGIRTEFNEKEKADARAVSEAKIEQAQKFLDVFSSITDVANQISANKFNFDKQVLDAKTQAENEAFDAKFNKEFTVATEAEVERAKLNKIQIERENELIISRNEQLKKQFRINKAFAIAEIGLTTAIAVMKALANPPAPPFSIPQAIAAGVAGAVQMAAVAARKFEGGAATLAVPKIPTLAARELPTPSPSPGTQQTIIKPPAGAASGGFGQGTKATGGFDVPGLLCPQCPQFETPGDEVFGSGGAGQRQNQLTAVVSERQISEVQDRLRKFEERRVIGG